MSSPEPTTEEMLDDLFARMRAISGSGAVLQEIPGRPGVFEIDHSGGTP